MVGIPHTNRCCFFFFFLKFSEVVLSLHIHAHTHAPFIEFVRHWNRHCNDLREMNPLTQIKNTNKATRSEVALGLGGSSSWHARFKHSAYVYVGGLPYQLTEGDVLAVFAQYGEIVDVHLVRDRKTGKSKGFAFLAYEDQRSTVLAVDNLSGARVGGRIIRVEHVDNYRKKRAEVEGDGEFNSNNEEIQTTSVVKIPPSTLSPVDETVDVEKKGPAKSFMDLMQEAKSKGLLSRPWEKEVREEGEQKTKSHSHKRRHKSHRKERDGDGYRESKKR